MKEEILSIAQDKISGALLSNSTCRIQLAVIIVRMIIIAESLTMKGGLHVLGFKLDHLSIIKVVLSPSKGNFIMIRIIVTCQEVLQTMKNQSSK